MIYIRYYKKVGTLPLIILPFLYIGLMSGIDFMSYTMVSEQFQVPLLIILFLELYCFYRDKKLSKRK